MPGLNSDRDLLLWLYLFGQLGGFAAIEGAAVNVAVVTDLEQTVVVMIAVASVAVKGFNSTRSTKAADKCKSGQRCYQSQ